MVEQENAIFLHKDVRNILSGKIVVVLGDSIQRSVYKDLVCLWHDHNSRYLTDSELRAKGELSFLGDKLLLGGQLGDRVNGVQYREVREYREGDTVFRFYFITRCFNEHVESVLNEFNTLKPDILIMNSCYWDVHHYGEEGRSKYGFNLEKLFSSIRALPSKPLLLWNSALPLGEYCKGGFLRQGFKTLPRVHVQWANEVACNLIHKYDFLYIDLFYSLDRHHFFTQAEDGIHWGNRAHRKISNSVLTAISRKWELPIPVHITSPPDFAPFEKFTEHSWPDYHYGEFDYYGYVERSFDDPIVRPDCFRTPRPLLGLGTEQNFLTPENFQSFQTPPVYNNIYIYNDPYSREYMPSFGRGEYSPMNEYFPRYFSEPLPRRNPKVGRHNYYKRRFEKIKQLTIPKRNPQPDTALNTQNTEATKLADMANNNSVKLENPSSTCTPPRIETGNAIPEKNRGNSDTSDVMNKQGSVTEKVECNNASGTLENGTQDSVGTRKRKRDEEEKDLPSPPAKQVKQTEDPAIKCQLSYDSFL